MTKIKNIGSKIIGVGKTILMPDEVIIVPDSVAELPAIKTFAKMHFLSVEKEETVTDSTVETTDDASSTEETPGEKKNRGKKGSATTEA